MEYTVYIKVSTPPQLGLKKAHLSFFVWFFFFRNIILYNP